MSQFLADGWAVFDAEPAVADWVKSARPYVRDILNDPTALSRWLRHRGTWFAGVNILPNDGAGRMHGPPLAGAVVDTACALYGDVTWDRGQLSVVYPGYPQQDASDSAAAHKFRRDKDAAHLDGLLPEGPNRRRHLREYHAFILGIPLDPVGQGGSPLVIYQGSHEVIRAAFLRAFHGHPPREWGDVDLTDLYTATRREVFATCPRVEVTAEPGQAILMHRLTIHGVAPWQGSPAARRAIAYFRPETQLGPQHWLEAP